MKPHIRTGNRVTWMALTFPAMSMSIFSSLSTVCTVDDLASEWNTMVFINSVESICIPIFRSFRSAIESSFVPGSARRIRGVRWNIEANALTWTLLQMAGIRTFCSTVPMEMLFSSPERSIWACLSATTFGSSPPSLLGLIRVTSRPKSRDTVMSIVNYLCGLKWLP